MKNVEPGRKARVNKHIASIRCSFFRVKTPYKELTKNQENNLGPFWLVLGPHIN